MSEATWKRRFRAPVVMFPTWARERPERLLYLSNAGGKFEVYAWDQRTGEKRQVTDRSEGTGYRVSSRLDEDEARDLDRNERDQQLLDDRLVKG